MENLKIEKLNQKDFNYIKENLKDFDDFWNEYVLSDEYISEFSKSFVIKNNKKIYGFAILKEIFKTAEIMNIAIHKNFRNIGIGSTLLSHIISYCKNQNIETINLEVNSKNSLAIILYKKYNFIEVGFRKNYYRDGSDAILMSLYL